VWRHFTVAATRKISDDNLQLHCFVYSDISRNKYVNASFLSLEKNLPTNAHSVRVEPVIFA